jgi:hypothetical protein
MVKNPFTPTFGVSPPTLVGRTILLDDFSEALAEGPGSPGRATIYTGARGSGKTVMLNEIEDRSRERGWVVISETASEGFVSRITGEQLPRQLRELDLDTVRHHLTGFTGPLAIGALTWETIEKHIVTWGLRSQVELLTDLLRERDREREVGVLFTLDEIHGGSSSELREFVTTVQHAFREDRSLAFVGAGLSAAISDVLNDDVLTFLRRAERYHLGRIQDEDVELAIRQPIEENGRYISGEALEKIVNGTDGYPFLIQLAGYHAWRCNPEVPEISISDADIGLEHALHQLGKLVCEPALKKTSEQDKAFLVAMAKDNGISKMSDVQQRLGVDKNYANQYRRRLIAAELIAPAGHGQVDFALPYLRGHLREHAVSDV